MSRDKAHLALNGGDMFDLGGKGFMRLNISPPLVLYCVKY